MAPIGIFEFFDLAFVRVVFNLAVDYLISAGYLLPTQRSQWVDGYAHIIGLIGAVVFMAIWQHQSHKKPTTQITATTTTTDSPADTTPLIEKKVINVADVI